MGSVGRVWRTVRCRSMGGSCGAAGVHRTESSGWGSACCSSIEGEGLLCAGGLVVCCVCCAGHACKVGTCGGRPPPPPLPSPPPASPCHTHTSPSPAPSLPHTHAPCLAASAPLVAHSMSKPAGQGGGGQVGSPRGLASCCSTHMGSTPQELSCSTMLGVLRDFTLEMLHPRSGFETLRAEHAAAACVLHTPSHAHATSPGAEFAQGLQLQGGRSH